MMLGSRNPCKGQRMLAVMRREQLLGNNPRGATLVAALVDVQGADVEAFAALELFGRELLKPQCTAEIHLLESKRICCHHYWRSTVPSTASIKQNRDGEVVCANMPAHERARSACN